MGSASHFEWIKQQKNTKIVWFSKIFLSFDVGSIRQSDCSGVSCPSPIGLTAIDAAQICFNSGKNKNVSLMDMSEFNPLAESYKTGKLLAWLFYNFVLGVAQRQKNNKKSKL